LRHADAVRARGRRALHAAEDPGEGAPRSRRGRAEFGIEADAKVLAGMLAPDQLLAQAAFMSTTAPGSTRR
jgi:hypothetical protein